MTYKTTVVLLAALTLGACAPSQAIMQNKDVEPTNVTAKPGVEAPAVRRLVPVPVNAYYKSAKVAATCTWDAPAYSATFTTPATVLVPDYGNKTPVVTVSCRNDQGEGAKTVVAESKAETNAAAYGGALFGVLGAMIAAGAVSDNDGDHLYRRVSVRLK